MNSIAGCIGAMGVAALVAISPQISWAEEFTGTEFLTWTEGQQRSYLNAQLVMASSIVTRAKPDMAQCISDLYYGENGLTPHGLKDLQKNIRAFETYHPSSVLVVVLEKECGRFF